MVQLVLGMSELPRPDDAADALAIATWVANTDRGARARHGRRPGPGGGRADHPRRDGLRARGPRSHRRRACRRRVPTSATPRSAPTRIVIASVEGVVGAVAADSLVIEVGGIGYRVFAAPAILAVGPARQGPQAPHVPPRPRGPAGAVRLPLGRGARLLHAAADRQRRRPEGRPRDRRVAPDARPPARDHGPGPGGPRRRSRASARSSPSGSSSSSARR